MDLADIFSHFEKSNTFANKELCTTLLNELSNNINESSLSKILETDNRYKRVFFAIGANETTLTKFAQAKNIDPHFKTLFAHTLLCRLSSQQFVEPSTIAATTQIVFNQKAQEPGTTLGMAIGYTLGRLLHNGNDVRDFLKLCSPTYVHNYKIFLKGFKAGCDSSAQGLMKNSSYVTAIEERYDDWQTSSFNICKKLYTFTGDQNNYENAKINPLNEKITAFLQAFFPDNTLINALHEAHIEKLSFLNSKTLESPEIAAAVDKLVIKRSNALISEIEDNYDQTLAKEMANMDQKLQAETDRLNQRMLDYDLQLAKETAKLNQTIQFYDDRLHAEVARIERQSIDNAHIILDKERVIKNIQEQNAQSVALKNRLNKML